MRPGSPVPARRSYARSTPRDNPAEPPATWDRSIDIENAGLNPGVGRRSERTGSSAGAAVRSSGGRYRSTAVAGTILLHVLLAGWLFRLRFEPPPPGLGTTIPVWVAPLPPLPPPPPATPLAIPDEPVEPSSFRLAEPVPEPALVREHDWFGDARAVAREFGRDLRSQAPGSAPIEPEEEREPKPPPTVFEQPLPRKGTTVTTPEGETILWVSDYCYISLGSTSLTMQDLHQARMGVRRCIIPVGRREPRGDLFEPLKRRPEKQQ